MQHNRHKSEAAGMCLLTETYHPITGGGETQARVLAAGFAASGSETNVLTRRTDSTLPRSEHMDDATLWRLAPAGPGHLKKWGLILSAFIRLLRLRSRYEVMLVCGYRVLGIPSVIASRLLHRRVLRRVFQPGPETVPSPARSLSCQYRPRYSQQNTPPCGRIHSDLLDNCG
jgi:hypothetical protein